MITTTLGIQDSIYIFSWYFNIILLICTKILTKIIHNLSEPDLALFAIFRYLSTSGEKNLRVRGE